MSKPDVRSPIVHPEVYEYLKGQIPEHYSGVMVETELPRTPNQERFCI